VGAKLMNTFIAIHEHRHGTSVEVFKAETNELQKVYEYQDTIINALGMDVEENEDLEFIMIDDNKTPEIIL
jgi:hypothetical protein